MWKATQDFAAQWGDGRLAFAEGDTVSLDDEVADWVNRCSPGTLAPADVGRPAKGTTRPVGKGRTRADADDD